MATTFTRRTNVTNPEDGSHTVTESTVEGSATRVRSDAQRFSALKLDLTENPTLFFVPTTYGEVPEPGDEVTWPANGPVYKVADVDPIAPDGVVIAARVVIGR